MRDTDNRETNAIDRPGSNWKLRIIVLASCLLMAVASCAFLRISKVSDLRAYVDMASSFHPVWKQFALRQFGPGDSTNQLFKRFPPSRRTEFGRYGIYSFWPGPPDGIPFSSFTVTTRDGKLLSAGAGSCTWSFTFFNAPDPELDRQYSALVNQQILASKQFRLNLYSLHLQRFYTDYHRWPTNEGEFGTFVTGERPPEPQSRLKAGQLTAEQRRFRERYGLSLDEPEAPNSNPNHLTAEQLEFRKRYGLSVDGVDQPSDPSPFNPLGITLTEQPNGEMCVAFRGETDPASIAQRKEP